MPRPLRQAAMQEDAEAASDDADDDHAVVGADVDTDDDADK